MTTDLSLDEVIQRMSDFDLCNAISCAVETQFGYDRLMTWPPDAPFSFRVVHFAWSTTGFIEGEGLARFFNLPCKHSAFPECLEALELPALADDIRALLKLFPECDLGQTDALISHFGSWERIEEIVDAAESRLYAESKNIQSRVAGFIRERKQEFEPLLPEIRRRKEYRKLLQPVGTEKPGEGEPENF